MLNVVVIISVWMSNHKLCFSSSAYLQVSVHILHVRDLIIMMKPPNKGHSLTMHVRGVQTSQWRTLSNNGQNLDHQNRFNCTCMTQWPVATRVNHARCSSAIILHLVFWDDTMCILPKKLDYYRSPPPGTSLVLSFTAAKMLNLVSMIIYRIAGNFGEH